MITYVIGADEADRLGSMAVYFLLAVLIVAPYAVIRVRRVLRDRRRRQADADGPGTTIPPRDATPAADGPSEAADPLTAAVASIDAAAIAGEDLVEVRLPIEEAPERRTVPRDLADLVLADALRRSGYVIEDDRIEHGERVLRCRRTDRPTGPIDSSDQ